MNLLTLDHATARWVYDLHLPEGIVAVVTHTGTRGGVWLVAGLALAVFGRELNRRTGLALLAGLAAHVALIEGLVKHSVERQRPFVTLGFALRDSLLDPDTYSFPSGHSTASFLGATVLGARFPRWRTPLLVLAGLVAVTRVHMGAHYPSDVLFGAVVGVVMGMALVRAFRLAPLETNDGPPAESAPLP